MRSFAWTLVVSIRTKYFFLWFLRCKRSRMISARSDRLFWKLSCVAIEKQMALWRQRDSMEKLSLTSVQYSTIDALLLMHVGNTSYEYLYRERMLLLKKKKKKPITRGLRRTVLLVYPARETALWSIGNFPLMRTSARNRSAWISRITDGFGIWRR